MSVLRTTHYLSVQCDVIVAYASVKKYCNRHQLVELRWRTHLDDQTRVKVALKHTTTCPFND